MCLESMFRCSGGKTESTDVEGGWSYIYKVSKHQKSTKAQQTGLWVLIIPHFYRLYSQVHSQYHQVKLLLKIAATVCVYYLRAVLGETIFSYKTITPHHLGIKWFNWNWKHGLRNPFVVSVSSLFRQFRIALVLNKLLTFHSQILAFERTAIYNVLSSGWESLGLNPDCIIHYV
jgi:hypothetical protein